MLDSAVQVHLTDIQGGGHALLTALWLWLVLCSVDCCRDRLCGVLCRSVSNPSVDIRCRAFDFIYNLSLHAELVHPPPAEPAKVTRSTADMSCAD